MIRSLLIVVLAMAGMSAVAVAPAARADDQVTYEVLSGYVHTADVVYYDRSEPVSRQNVPLPWRTNAAVINPSSRLTDGAQLRARWQPAASPSWVTIRIYVRGSLICESTLESGKAACYGNTRSETGD